VTQQLDGLREEDAEYDPPLSQEVKSPAYPSGPVRIYDPHVYLYLEPNEEEAYEFDVVINVAREVKNPFGSSEEKSTTPVQRSISSPGQSISEPGTACTAASFQTALESQPTPTAASPTTPRATVPRMQPEYIHMPWDHNTSIVDDLVILVETIDERVKQGKKVLIHCQCGVSRSASLIVAYGIYKNPSLTVQEAYDAVKQRSRWIGPNMSLIYQLSEFRNQIVKMTGAPPAGYRSRRAGGGMRANTVTNGSPTARPSLSLEPYEPQRQEPQTAPLPGDRDRTARSSPRTDEPQAVMSAKQLSPPSFSFGNVSPIDPLSAPPDGPAVSWPLPATPFGTNQQEAATSVEGRSTDRFSTTPFPPLPTEPPAQESLNRILRMSPSHPQLRQQRIVSHTINLPPPSTSEPTTPALLSPRTEFMANPFLPQIAAASSFGFSSNVGLPDDPVESTASFEQDPRSPAQRGEAPMVRSIFDVL
jgi:tyrosine-protein phosphatase